MIALSNLREWCEFCGRKATSMETTGRRGRRVAGDVIYTVGSYYPFSVCSACWKGMWDDGRPSIMSVVSEWRDSKSLKEIPIRSYLKMGWMKYPNKDVDAWAERPEIAHRILEDQGR